MTTYTVTATSATGTETFYGKTAAEVKTIKKNLWGCTVTSKKEQAVKEAPKTAYYRGNQIDIVEERHNNWTLVSNSDGSRYFYLAVTTEIEYR